ncbi:hypothetical protein RJT34_31056 [Clitoria ternatea]|uniref:Uncharacterized protein n=1 Tax=Clitoria ternatea TaxID=43366 RepID=A0AAN9EVQ0_CLITE
MRRTEDSENKEEGGSENLVRANVLEFTANARFLTLSAAGYEVSYKRVAMLIERLVVGCNRWNKVCGGGGCKFGTCKAALALDEEL